MDNSNVIPQNVASQPFDEEIQAIEQNRPKRAAHIDGAQIGTLRICFIMAGFVSIVDLLVQILIYILV